MNSRLACAELVRHFLSGRITNHEYDKLCGKLLDDGDAAVTQIMMDFGIATAIYASIGWE